MIGYTTKRDTTRGELVTAKDPYFRGIETDTYLPDGMWVEPARFSRPKRPRVCYFDQGNGWLTHTFVPRAEDPQITVEQGFWQEYEPPTAPPAEL
ncbi:hypothetical protein ACH4U3_22370 [Streptomyces griseoruber]|uniref:hypothetical protein n=1 Tax=Streptomyces griseoruber TaxID=1943 RepID=UPI0037AA9325